MVRILALGSKGLSLLLLGSSNLIAFGLTSVEVSIKKISNRNTRSAIDAELNSVLLLFLVFIAMTLMFFYAGSFKISINSVARASRMNTTFSILATITL